MATQANRRRACLMPPAPEPRTTVAIRIFNSRHKPEKPCTQGERFNRFGIEDALCSG